MTGKHILLIIFIINATACNISIDQDLPLYINKQLTNEPTTLSFVDYKMDKWNKLYIIQPYLNETRLDKTLLPYKQEIFDTGIKTQDHMTLLILVKDENLVSITPIKPPITFLSEAVTIRDNRYSYWRRSQTQFKVKKDGTIYYIMGGYEKE